MDFNNGIIIQYIYKRCDQGDVWYTINLPIAFTKSYCVGATTISYTAASATTNPCYRTVSTVSQLIIALAGCNNSWAMSLILIGF